MVLIWLREKQDTLLQHLNEYEEELRRTKEEVERRDELLAAIVKPRVLLHKADVQQVLVEGPEKVSSDQVCSQRLRMTKGNKRVWSSQDGEELHGLVEAGVNTFPWTLVCLKCEEDEVLTTTPPHHPSVEKLNPVEADGEDRGESTSTVHADIPAASSETVCSQCGKGFANMRTLRRHLKTHTGPADMPFSCPKCKKTYAAEKTLNQHLLTHAAVRRFVCRVCRTAFTRRQHLKRHMGIHTREDGVSAQHTKKSRVGVPEPSIACVFCARVFPNKFKLDKHMQTHIRKKPFKCGVCDKRLARQSGRNHKCITENGRA
ncbi:uncharacterized protein LOC144027669 isoform X2 [Festucalex cinctus]